MGLLRWPGPVDLLFATAAVAVIARTALRPPASSVGVAMVLFAFFVLVVTYSESRWFFRLVDQSTASATQAIALTALMLVVWTVLSTLQNARLDLYFALLALFFFLQAVRSAAVLGVSPVELVLQGYATLVAVSLVMGALADGIDRFRVLLVAILATFFVVRKLFVWWGAILSRIVPDPS